MRVSQAVVGPALVVYKVLSLCNNNTIQDTSQEPSMVLTGLFSWSIKKISSALRPVPATSL